MNQTVSVFEANITINGNHIIVALGNTTDKLAHGIILSSDDGKQWQILNNRFQWRDNFMKLVKEKEAEGIFFYHLKGIGHMEIPNLGQRLTILPNVLLT
jgi:hypothetical protein